jgi:hypothetical protein
MSFVSIGSNDQRLKKGKKTPRKGFLTGDEFFRIP